MANLCIPKEDAARLHKQFSNDGITIASLYEMDSAGRREVFEKSLGKDAAKASNALFEKSMMSNQTNAIKNWIWKNLYSGKPLYSSLTLDQSQKMKDAFTMKGLREMESSARVEAFAKIVDPNVATELNKRFESLQQSGNLGNWEQRVFGSDAMLADKKLKGAFAKLESLNDLGVLTPKQTEKFMEDFVADKFGVNVTQEEAAEISGKTTAVSEAYEVIKGDWTADNSKAVIEYFVKRKALEDYINRIDPVSATDVFFSVGARGSMLFAARSFVNNFLYQWFPITARLVSKRILNGSLTPGDYSQFEKITASVTSTLTPIFQKQVWKQVWLGIKIYQKTGYDIARMDSLDAGFKYFGEKFTSPEGPGWRESKGVKAKIGAIARRHAKIMAPALKYIAGGPDIIFAHIQRADTSMLVAQTIAKLEKKNGKLPEGMSAEDRVTQLFKDSYRPDPQSLEGVVARNMGTMDAHGSNLTHEDVYSDISLKFRDAFGLGNKSIGKALLPFIKIPANALGLGLEIAVPVVGVARGAHQAFKALSLPEGAERTGQIYEGLTRTLVSAGGFALAAALVSALFDDDDYISAYDYTKRNENALNLAENTGANYVRVGGQWYAMKFLGPLAIPVSAIMEARKSHSAGRNAAAGYLMGVFTGIMQFPGFQEAGEWVEAFSKASKKDDFEAMAKAMDFTGADIAQWIAVRTLTSTAAYDIGSELKKDRHDALGRRLPRKSDDGWSLVRGVLLGANVKDDTSNALTREFGRLGQKGEMPTLVEPSGKNAKQAQLALGETQYVDELNKLKRKYAEQVEMRILTVDYQMMSPEEQSKAINQIREDVIMSGIKEFAKLVPVSASR